MNDNLTIAFTLKDNLSAGLQGIRKQLQQVEQAAMRASKALAALPHETLTNGTRQPGQATQEDSAKQQGARTAVVASFNTSALDSLALDALKGLRGAFQDYQRSLTQAYGQHGQGRQYGEHVVSKQSSALRAAPTSWQQGASQQGLSAAEASQDAFLDQQTRRHEAELQALLEHGERRQSLTRQQAEAELGIRQNLFEQERQLDESRLEWTHAFAHTMQATLSALQRSGLAQGQSVFKVYQALAVAEATISTYKAAQNAYAQGIAFGGVGGITLGSVMAAAAIAAGMARVAAIRGAQPKGYAFGGLIQGEDRGDRADNVFIRATPGEYMLDRPTVRHYGLGTLDALRKRSIPKAFLESFAFPALPQPPFSAHQTAYAYGGQIGTGSLAGAGMSASGGTPLHSPSSGSLLSGGTPRHVSSAEEPLTVINVMDVQRELERALASVRGRRLLINVLGEEGVAVP